MNFISPKPTPDWYGDIIVSEKIDGLYGAIYAKTHILDEQEPLATTPGSMVIELEQDEDGTRFFREIAAADFYGFVATDDERDLLGFARWVRENAELLSPLLPDGIHAGVWWGAGIEREYGGVPRRFSLFNVRDFYDPNTGFIYDGAIDGLYLVPVLYCGPLIPENGTDPIAEALRRLSYGGSRAAPGFREPEGVVITHVPSGATFKAEIT